MHPGLFLLTCCGDWSWGGAARRIRTPNLLIRSLASACILKKLHVVSSRLTQPHRCRAYPLGGQIVAPSHPVSSLHSRSRPSACFPATIEQRRKRGRGLDEGLGGLGCQVPRASSAPTSSRPLCCINTSLLGTQQTSGLSSDSKAQNERQKILPVSQLAAASEYLDIV